MPFYRYQSMTLSGQRKRGTMDAVSEDDVKVKLRSQNEYLLECHPAKEKRRSNFLTATNRVPPRTVASFARQFAILIKAGVSVSQSLDTLRKQNFSTYFKNVISDIYDSVLKGMYLSDSFKKYPKIFKSFFVNMIHIGEISGNLPTVLNKVADYLENDYKVKSKAKNALIYPSFLLVIIIGIVILLMVVVVPQFEETITKNGGTMPALTLVVIGISDFIRSWWYILLPGLIGLVLFLWFFLTRTDRGKYCRSYITLHLPVLRNISLNLITTRFTTAFSILIESGMDVIDSLEAMIPILDNRLFEARFVYAIEDIKRGKRIAPSIEKCDIFPRMLIEMLDVGEDTNSLAEVCDTVSKYYQEQLNNSIQRATALLEPCIIVFMGLVVGTIVLSILLPMISMTESFSDLENSVPDIDI